MHSSSRNMNKRACGCRYRLAVIEVERKHSFKDVDRLVILRMGVKRRPSPPGSNLLDKRKPTAGLLGAGLEGPEGPEAPKRLPVFGAKRVWGRVGGHLLLLSPTFPGGYLPYRFDAIQQTLVHLW